MTAEAPSAPQVAPMTRREFLYYVWAASMAIFTAEFTGLMIWFMFPRFRAGEFGGLFTLALGEIPPVDSEPAEFPAGRFWLVNLGEKRLNDSRQPTDYVVQPGVRVLYKVCVHLGCLYKWVPTNDRFECPCHGSKYLVTGTRIDGPATRNLDTFQFDFVDANGSVIAAVDLVGEGRTAEAGSVPLPSNAASIRVNTGDRINGAHNTAPGGGL
ncbi:MAG: ubiquinol-cytochrome c reductase iron-sulfur subunit [Anaerolineales bacterium]